jgi:hypothetical protein
MLRRQGPWWSIDPPLQGRITYGSAVITGGTEVLTCGCRDGGKHRHASTLYGSPRDGATEGTIGSSSKAVGGDRKHSNDRVEGIGPQGLRVLR